MLNNNCDTKFSLCITTKDRFDNFLITSLPKYIDNPYIDEIIICDENGHDAKKIKNTFNSGKINIFVNEKPLGAFFNKLKVLNLANNEWMCLMDSDNFEDINYFECCSNYIIQNNPPQHSILSPCFARPNFNFTSIAGKVVDKSNISKISNEHKTFDILMNLGNYVINQHLLKITDIIEILIGTDNPYAPAEVLLFNTMLFETYDLKFHIIRDMNYEHIVHDGSLYKTSYLSYPNELQKIYDRFNILKHLIR